MFLRHVIDLAPPRVLEAVKEIRGRLKHPPMNAEAYLDRLLNQHELPQTFAFLKKYIGLI